MGTTGRALGGLGGRSTGVGGGGGGGRVRAWLRTHALGNRKNWAVSGLHRTSTSRYFFLLPPYRAPSRSITSTLHPAGQWLWGTEMHIAIALRAKDPYALRERELADGWSKGGSPAQGREVLTRNLAPPQLIQFNNGRALHAPKLSWRTRFVEFGVRREPFEVVVRYITGRAQGHGFGDAGILRLNQRLGLAILPTRHRKQNIPGHSPWPDEHRRSLPNPAGNKAAAAK